MINSRHTIISSLVPDNPKPQQIIEMPGGQVLGASHVISILKGEDLIGDAIQLSPVYNVSGKYTLNRATTCVSLRKGMRIRILAQQFSYNSAIFVQHFGWMGHNVLGPPTVLSDHTYKIDHVLRVGPDSIKFFVYEKICLTITEEK